MKRYLIYMTIVCSLFFLLCGCDDGGLPAEKYYEKGLVILDDDVSLAIKYFNKAIEKNPTFAAAYSTRGLAYNKKGEYDKAISDNTKAISIDPNDAQAYFGRAYAYSMKRDYNRAIEDYNKAIALDPNDSGIYTSRAFVYIKRGDYNQAIEDYNKAIALDPNSAAAYNNRGVAYAKKGEYDKAITDCTKSIDFNPDSASYYKCALIYSLKGDVAGACDQLNKAIEAGFNDWEYIKQDPDFNKSRDSDCYKSILKGH